MFAMQIGKFIFTSSLQLEDTGYFHVIYSQLINYSAFNVVCSLLQKRRKVLILRLSPLNCLCNSSFNPCVVSMRCIVTFLHKFPCSQIVLDYGN